MKAIKIASVIFFLFAVNNVFTQNNPIVGGVESLAYKFTESSIRYPINYEIKVTPTQIEITTKKATDAGVESTTKSKKISKKNWDQLVDLSGKLQEAGTHYPDGGTGYKTHEIIRQNGGAPEAYSLIWTSLTEDKADSNTKLLVAKIKTLAAIK